MADGRKPYSKAAIQKMRTTQEIMKNITTTKHRDELKLRKSEQQQEVLDE
jgi:hypothetical protein